VIATVYCVVVLPLFANAVQERQATSANASISPKPRHPAESFQTLLILVIISPTQDQRAQNNGVYGCLFTKRVTRLWLDSGNGDQAALDELIPLAYDELRRLAGRTCGARARVTHCKRQLLSTRPICDWLIRRAYNDRTGRTVALPWGPEF